MHWRHRLLVVILGAFALSPHGVLAADPTGRTLRQLRTVMLSDENLDGRPNVFLQHASRYSLNNHGQAAFVTFRNSTPRLWAETDEGRVFHAAPADEVGQLHITDAGEVIFGTVTIAQGSPRPDHIWSWSGDQVTQLAGIGLPVRDETSAVMAGYDQARADLLAVHSGGAYAFYGAAADASTDIVEFAGVWLGQGPQATARLALRLGADAPGLGASTRFTSTTNFSLPAINAQAHQVFTSGLEGPDVRPGENELSMWLYRDGQLEMLYRQGDSIPDTNDASRFGSFPTIGPGAPSINNRDSISFLAGQVDATGDTQFVIWARRDGQLQAVATSGEPLSDRPGGIQLANLALLSDTAINAQDSVAFRAQVQGGPFSESAFGLFVEDASGQLHTAVLPGDVFPQLRADAAISVPRDMQFQFNARGQLAFEAPYNNGTPQERDDSGIFVYDVDHVLKPIAVVGDAIEVAPGDNRIIQRLNMPNLGGGNQDGVVSLFNDQGQLLFQAMFTDGTSGLFVSSAVAIPEPHAVVLLALGAGLLAARRRELSA